MSNFQRPVRKRSVSREPLPRKEADVNNDVVVPPQIPVASALRRVNVQSSLDDHGLVVPGVKDDEDVTAESANEDQEITFRVRKVI